MLLNQNFFIDVERNIIIDIWDAILHSQRLIS